MCSFVFRQFSLSLSNCKINYIYGNSCPNYSNNDILINPSTNNQQNYLYTQINFFNMIFIQKRKIISFHLINLEKVESNYILIESRIEQTNALFPWNVSICQFDGNRREALLQARVSLANSVDRGSRWNLDIDRSTKRLVVTRVSCPLAG